MSMTHDVLIVMVAALVTAAIRFAPFVLMRGKETPPYIAYLGKVLPYAIIAMLVVYCLKDVSLLQAPHGVPELIAGLTVVALHVWRRNTLLSIVGGTAVYMVLLQTVL